MGTKIPALITDEVKNASKTFVERQDSSKGYFFLVLLSANINFTEYLNLLVEDVVSNFQDTPSCILYPVSYLLDSEIAWEYDLKLPRYLILFPISCILSPVSYILKDDELLVDEVGTRYL